jgi:hypothetical protein
VWIREDSTGTYLKMTWTHNWPTGCSLPDFLFYVFLSTNHSLTPSSGKHSCNPSVSTSLDLWHENPSDVALTDLPHLPWINQPKICTHSVNECACKSKLWKWCIHLDFFRCRHLFIFCRHSVPWSGRFFFPDALKCYVNVSGNKNLGYCKYPVQSTTHKVLFKHKYVVVKSTTFTVGTNFWVCRQKTKTCW